MIKAFLSHVITDEEFLFSLMCKIEDKYLISYLNQHSFNICKSDKNYLKLLMNYFSLYLADFGMFYALKFLGYNPVNKFNGTDLNHKFFDYLIEKHIPLYVVGGSFNEQEINEIFKKRELNLTGYSNGYHDSDSINDLAKKISKTEAKIIVLGLGVPKQEIVAFSLSQLLPDRSFLCVGNFLEFYLGTQKRAPEFLRNSGFEWLFRLLSEPKRLWKRYLIGIPVFIFRIIKLKLTLRT